MPIFIPNDSKYYVSCSRIKSQKGADALKKAGPTHKHRAVARQNVEVVPGLAGGSFCPACAEASAGRLDFSCFVLCIKAKNEMGFGAKPRMKFDWTERHQKLSRRDLVQGRSYAITRLSPHELPLVGFPAYAHESLPVWLGPARWQAGAIAQTDVNNNAKRYAKLDSP